MPDAFSRRSTSNSRATSPSSRLDVGSSRINTRASTDTARAIATICCTAIGYASSERVTSSDRSSSASAARERAWIVFQSIAPRRIGCRPAKMFSATDRFAHRFTSW